MTGPTPREQARSSPHGVWTYEGELHPVSVEEPAPNAVKPVLHRFASHDGLELTDTPPPPFVRILGP
jgi:hypothetical protein